MTELEIRYAADAAKNGWGTECYGYLDRFEQIFQDYLGVRHTLATSSCTGALHMGLSALGVRAGTEVILADTNWIASVAPIVHLGASPVFVDVLPDTWCIDPRCVERAITSKTRAILAVHLYGNLCNMSALLALGEKHGIPIIEDAAEALGSRYHGKLAGSMGAFGAFSFHGTKTVSTGEGGMFVTNDTTLYENVVMLSNHGRSSNETRQFWSELVGFKYRMSNIQAAIGCGQMERISQLLARKREIFAVYFEGLRDLPGISMNPEPPGMHNSFWMPTVVFAPETGVTRERLLAACQKENIDARVFFWPLSGLPPFEANPGNTNAWSLPGRAINLPSYHDMTLEDQHRVIHAIRRVAEEHADASVPQLT